MARLYRRDAFLITSFAALAVCPVLYLFRAFDDNTLASWRWVFEGAAPGVGWLFVLLAAGTALAAVVSRWPFPARHPKLSLAALSLLIIAPLRSMPESILDAGRYFSQAKYLEQFGVRAFLAQWGGELGAWTDLPLVPFLYGLLFRLFGEARLVAQCFTALLFTGTVTLVYSIGKRLWNEQAGLGAGLMLLAMPYLATQAPLMLVDVPAMFFLVLAVHACLRALESEGAAPAAAAAAAVCLAALTKYSVWFMLSVLPVLSLAVHQRSGNRRVLLRSLAILAAAVALTAVALAPFYGVVREQLALLGTYQWQALHVWGESAVSTFLFQVHPFVTALALFGLIKGTRRRDARVMIFGWFLLFLLLLPSGRIRYMLPLFPLLALAAGYGLSVLPVHREARRFIALCAVAASTVIVFGAYRPFLASTSMANLQHAGAYLDSIDAPAVEVKALPQRASSGNTEAAIPLLDLYTKKRLVYRPGAVAPPEPETISRLPLRFTWEWRFPKFYEPRTEDSNLPVLVLADGTGPFFPAMPPQNRSASVLKRFEATSGAFRFKTFVTLYAPAPLAGSAH